MLNSRPQKQCINLTLAKQAITIIFVTTFARSQQVVEDVSISIQPTYGSLPAYLAFQKGWWNELGLNISTETYSSGFPQVMDAIRYKTWDIGVAGSVPAIIGSDQGIIQTVGISNEESCANVLVGNEKVAEEGWPPSLVEKSTASSKMVVTVTPNSTGEFAAQACLRHFGYNLTNDVDFEYAQPSGVVSSLSMSNISVSNYGGMWSPFSYLLLNNVPDAAILCRAETSGMYLPGVLMVREEFGSENPDKVARILAGYLRGVSFIKNLENLNETMSYMESFYNESGVSISDDEMLMEILTRPIFDLNEQLAIMNRAQGNASSFDNVMTNVSGDMVAFGTIDNEPNASSYITDNFLMLVKNNETLRDFSLKDNA